LTLTDRLKTTFHIAVRSLIEQVFRSGDLNLEFTGAGRSVDAIRAHQRVQNSRPENYTPEVTVSHRIETDRFVLEIGGRIDGVYAASEDEKRETVIVEEIKTTKRQLDDFRSHDEPVHWGQLKMYAFIYATRNELKEIQTQLTYYHLDSGQTLEILRHFDILELETFFQEVVRRYLEWAEALSEWRKSRDASIGEVSFPFAEFRPGQREMAASVFRGIRSNSQLIVQAATGIGKTMAAIFPAVKAIGEGHCQKIFYLTARTTGKSAAENALSEMRQQGLKLKSLTLTAKDKVCPSGGAACTPEECAYARGYYDRLRDALKEFFCCDGFDRQAIEGIASKHRICPFEYSLELSNWVDCIICDYNYAFDPRVYLRRFFLEENSDDYTFLVDEAHNLVDRSREMFSAEIRKQTFLDLRRLVKKALPKVYKSLGRINYKLVKVRKQWDPSGDPFTEKSPPESLFPLLREFLTLAERWLARNIRTPFRDSLVDLYFAVSGFLKVAEHYDESYATCYEKLKKDLKVKLFCVDPSIQVGDALKRCRSAVFFSGTMTPARYFKKMFGCETSAQTLVLPSPFPEENFGVFISHRISTLYKDRSRTRTDVSDIMASFVGHRKGNYLLFFPSYEYMTMIYDAFTAELPAIDTIIQTPFMSEPDRDAFLKRFQAENPDTLVGFAVMGGIFGEGIDLKGERLSGVAVVGVGLPGICLERELIRQYFSEHYQAGFEYAYLYPGINRVLQAAGRVIRSESDRGVVLLVDQRFSNFRYKSLLPKHWASIKIDTGRRLASKLSAFWN
jgi:DNA excision repair protein ERCC-2